MAGKNIPPEVRKIFGLINVVNKKYNLRLQLVDAEEEDEKLKIWTVKTMSYAEQFAMDVFLIAMNTEPTSRFGAKRLKRLYEHFSKTYDYFNDKRNEDIDHMEHEMDGKLQQICGEFFVPHDDRYHITIKDHDCRLVVESDGRDVQEAICSFGYGNTPKGKGATLMGGGTDEL